MYVLSTRPRANSIVYSYSKLPNASRDGRAPPGQRRRVTAGRTNRSLVQSSITDRVRDAIPGRSNQVGTSCWISEHDCHLGALRPHNFRDYRSGSSWPVRRADCRSGTSHRSPRPWCTTSAFASYVLVRSFLALEFLLQRTHSSQHPKFVAAAPRVRPPRAANSVFMTAIDDAVQLAKHQV